MNQAIVKINPNDPNLLSEIQKAAAQGYAPDQVAVLLNLPYGPFMYAMMREPIIRHAWELGMLRYQTRYLRIAEGIAEDASNKQALAGAIYCHRHAVDTQRRAQQLRPENTSMTMAETLKIEEIVPPETMKIAMDDYKKRQEAHGQD